MGKYDDVTDPIDSLDIQWEGKSGKAVETFITGELKKIVTVETIDDKINTKANELTKSIEDSEITRIEYDSVNETLSLYKGDGSVIKGDVSVTEAVYSYGLKLRGFKINNNTPIYSGNQTIQYSAGNTYYVGVSMYGATTSPNVKYFTGPFYVTFTFGGKSIKALVLGKIPANDTTLPSNIDFNELGIDWVDITDLFKTSDTGKITAEFSYKHLSSSGDLTPISDSLSFTITNVVIKLLPPGEIVVTTASVNFNLEGGNTSDYNLEGWHNPDNDGVVKNIDTGNRINLTFNKLTPGLNQFVVLAVKRTDPSIKTDFITVDILYQTDDLNEPVLVIENTNNTIGNNGLTDLYNGKLFRPSGYNEDVWIDTYFEDISEASELTQLIKTEKYSATDFDTLIKEVVVKKYIEISGESKKYLYVNFNNEPYYFFTVSDFNGDYLFKQNYKLVEIEPINEDFVYYQITSPSLNFDQSTGYINNVFITNDYSEKIGDSANIIDDLEVNEGWFESDGIIGFRALGGENKDIFKSPLPLGLSLNEWTIEMKFKTYNVSDENNSLCTFGGFELRPTLFCWATNNKEIFNKRNSQFCAEKETHLIITFHKNFSKNNLLYYPDYLQKNYQNQFDNFTGTFDLARIYINGAIDREIIFEDFDNITSCNNWEFLINPKSADIDFYLFRVYNNKALSLNDIKKNHTSLKLTKEEKLEYWDRENILNDDGKISFKKCYGKYNTVVNVFPKNARFPNYSWKADNSEKFENCTKFVSYKDPHLNLLYGGRLNNLEVKPQGSSAKRYLIHNVQDTMGKCANDSIFTPFSNLIPENNRFGSEPTKLLVNHYLMPEDKGDLKVTKLVGKVNFASSMLSHKLGACKLYHDAAIRSGILLPSGGRKAVHEEPFLYFYWETDLDDVSNVELADLLNTNAVKFMGFLTWGSGKGDHATFGYDKKKTPHYLLLEGAENGDVSAKFLCPWHELLRGESEEYSTSLGKYPTCDRETSIEKSWAYLRISDESIIHNQEAAWDIDFGCNEYEGGKFGIAEDARESLNKFREFYDFVYKHDYNFEVVSDTKNKANWDTTKKYYINAVSSDLEGFAAAGDLFRWDAINKEWVPAGLYYSNDRWELYNVLDEFKVQDSNQAKIAMRNSFIDGIGDYVDVDDISFHLAFIRFVVGTDNRAKNTYFQIIGNIYEENSETDELEVTGDYKVRLMLDDLDTILKTDNNGLLTKKYNLIEPSYTDEFKLLWGDSGGNVFFRLYDQCFETADKIRSKYGDKSILKYLTTIIEYVGEDVTSNINNLYNYFFKVLEEDFPNTAYNHTAEIYYESALLIKNSGVYESIGYQNNNVVPITLSHGPSLLAERLFLNKRINFLKSYVNDMISDDVSFSLLNTGGGSNEVTTILRMDLVPYLDFYPISFFASSKYLYDSGKSEYTTINNLTKEGLQYNNIYVNERGRSVNQGLRYENLYTKLNIAGIQTNSLSGSFYHLTDFTIDNTLLSEENGFTQGYPKFKLGDYSGFKCPVLKNLTFIDVELPDTMDLTLYPKLETVDFSNTSGLQSITLPKSSRLTTVKLPESLETLIINDNPKLTTIELADPTTLKELIIRRISSDFNFNSFLSSLFDLNNLELYNVDFEIEEDLLLRLISRDKWKITGKITIINSDGSLKAISFLTKQKLVEEFGNIDDPENNLYVRYAVSNIDSISCLKETSIYFLNDLTSGAIIPNPFGLNINNGNDVAIIQEDGKYILNIEYTIPEGFGDIATVNRRTGDVTLLKESDITATVTITVNTSSGSKTATCLTKFQWRAPDVGDFAYIDGTFSSTYNDEKTLIGLVYDKKKDSETEGTVYIIGKEYTDSYYTGYPGWKDSYSLLYGELLSMKNFLVNDLNISDYEKIDFTYNQRTGEIDSSTELTISHTGKADTKLYVDKVNGLLENINDSGYTGYVANTIDSIDELETALNNMVLIGNDHFSTFDKKTWGCLLFPYFYAMYLYEPKPQPGEIVHSLYQKYNWYAPSGSEFSWIIQQRGLSVNKKFTTILVNENISSNGTGIFSKAWASGLRYDCWNYLINSSSANNIVTDASDDDNFAYFKYQDYDSVRCEWIEGVYTNEFFGSLYLYSNLTWRCKKHRGIPFTQFKYSKK